MQSMIPKLEIGALDFIGRNSEYDGRGVVIAIWDTGVDPTARGLQVTSHGLPKIIDFIDASGSGDVKMLKSFKISENARRITTLTGRVVSIPNTWKPVDGVIRVGVKSAAELFPGALLDQLRSEAMDDCWCPTMQKLSALLKEANVSSTASPVDVEASSGVASSALDGNQSNGEEASSATAVGEEASSAIATDDASSNGTPVPTPSPEEVIPHTELDASPDFKTLQEWLASLPKETKQSSIKAMERILATLNEQTEYFAPVFDCFVFKGADGDFVACVDTSPYEEKPATLEDMPLMKDFTIARQIGQLGSGTLLYYTVKILEDGELLQIVTNSGSHGTHVAAIAAACFPPVDSSNPAAQLDIDGGNQNGVAPGAQIVSIKIGDTHLASMETNVALLRAINWTVKLKCDVVNYSFGELAFLPHFGRVYNHLTQFVMQTNVAFITSGGNNGPSLGTVGSPGGSIDGLIGVAPLLFPKMMEYMYCQPTWIKPKIDECTALETKSDHTAPPTTPLPSAYTWGSRGPSPDGSLGLTVAACGAAVADVAAWKCSAFDLLNGSSMSSPSVAGGVALVLSALRQSESEPLLRVPFILWRAAIFACAKPLPHLSPLDQGAGVFQVGPTFDYLRAVVHSSPSPRPDPIQDSETSVNRIESSPATEAVAPQTKSFHRFSGWRLCSYVTGPTCIADNPKHLHTRGIWLRSGWPSRHPDSSKPLPKISFTLHLEPHFCQGVPVEFKRNFSLNLSVQVGYNTQNEKKPDWLFIAPYVMLANRARAIPLLIDPEAFDQTSTDTVEFNPPSQVHHTSVLFVNADSPQKEILALLPITIQLPGIPRLDEDNGVYRFGLRGEFTPAQKVCRWFVRIPRGSSAGVLYVRRFDEDCCTPCPFTVSIVQPAPLGSVQGTGHEVVHRRIKLFSLTSGGVEVTARSANYDHDSGYFVFPFVVHWISDTVEVTIAQHHGADVPAKCLLSGHVDFHGLEVQPSAISFHSCQSYFNACLRSNFGLEGTKWEVESTGWILPVKPSSSTRSYLKLTGYEDGSPGQLGVHVLHMEYNFSCPFKTDKAVFDFRRLTSLLYESDIVQVIYHVYDGSGRYKGAGSYQSIASPKYRFKLTKAPYKLVAMVLYTDSKKISYEAKENDALDKLRGYPMLVRFPLDKTSQLAAPSGGGQSSDRPQLVLEVSTSLATLGLADVDYEKSYRLMSAASASSGSGSQLEGAVVDNADCKDSPKTDPLFGSLQKFPTVPGHLPSGASVSVIFGVVEENFAGYAVPGSYFEGNIHFYGNGNLQNTATVPLEVHVGPRNATTPSPLQPPKPSAVRGTFGLLASDLRSLRWIAEAHFGTPTSPVVANWVPPCLPTSSSSSSAATPGSSDGKSAPVKEGKKKSRRAHRRQPNDNADNDNPITKTLTSLTSCIPSHCSALADADDSTNADREAVWNSVRVAMQKLVDEASSQKAPAKCDPLAFLLPVAYDCGDVDDGLGDVPLLRPKELPPKDGKSESTSEDLTNVESPLPPSTVATESDKKTPEGAPEKSDPPPSISRVLTIEALCIYGRHVCERIVVYRQRHNGQQPSRLLYVLDLIITRLHQLLSTQKQTARAVQPLKNFLDVEDGATLSSAVALSPTNALKVKGPFNLFWLAQLFVLHPQVPLLEALIRMALQLDPHPAKAGSTAVTLGSKQTDHIREKASFNCASATFPWMVQQLHRMGLRKVAEFLARQMPSRFPAFDYTLMTPRNPTPPPSSTQGE